MCPSSNHATESNDFQFLSLVVVRYRLYQVIRNISFISLTLSLVQFNCRRGYFWAGDSNFYSSTQVPLLIISPCHRPRADLSDVFVPIGERCKRIHYFQALPLCLSKARAAQKMRARCGLWESCRCSLHELNRNLSRQTCSRQTMSHSRRHCETQATCRARSMASAAIEV